MVALGARLQEPTKTFLSLLRKHPEIRNQIRAPSDRTLLYVGSLENVRGVLGSFSKPIWKEIDDFKRTHPELREKETLNEVLRRIMVPDLGTTLFAYVQDLEGKWKEPKEPERFIVWRALSGIFASNASGAVSFQIGSGVTAAKVFAATEAAVLSRNPNVNDITKDLLAYFQRCIESKQVDINVGFISA
jgi:hypothetical protein